MFGIDHWKVVKKWKVDNVDLGELSVTFDIGQT